MGFEVVTQFVGAFVLGAIAYVVSRSVAEKLLPDVGFRLLFCMGVGSILSTAVGVWTLRSPYVSTGEALVAAAIVYVPIQVLLAAIDWRVRAPANENASGRSFAVVFALVLALGCAVAAAEQHEGIRRTASTRAARQRDAARGADAGRAWSHQRAPDGAFEVDMVGAVERAGSPDPRPRPGALVTMASLENATGCDMHMSSQILDARNLGAGSSVTQLLTTMRDAAQRAASIELSDQVPFAFEGGGGLWLVGSLTMPSGERANYEAKMFVTGMRTVRAQVLCRGRATDEATRQRFFRSLSVTPEPAALPN